MDAAAIDAPPLLLEYLDAHSYLRDYFDYRKRTEKRFSFETWSKELGLKSRSHLRMILMGKKSITQVFIETFSRTARLDGTEQEYFYLLVHYSQAKNVNDRRLYSAKMIKIIRGRTSTSEIEDHYKFLSNPTLPRILTLLTFDDLAATATDVGRAFGVTDSVAEGLLADLEAMGLAEKVETGGATHWKAKARVFKVPDRFGDLALARYHESSLQDAIEALKEPHHLRRYRSLILPLNTEELQELYAAFDDFMSSMVARFQSEEYKGRCLFQLNSNVFPAARPREDFESPESEADI